MIRYIGRFAPSPTGPLHIGSIFAALLSFLDARANQGQWLLRIEDIDSFRSKKEFIPSIFQDLERLGLFWDGEVIYQSQRLSIYQEYLAELIDKKLIYPCYCSRKELLENSSLHNSQTVYNSHCLTLSKKQIDANKLPSLRIKVPDKVIEFDDIWCGHCQQQLQTEVGDFIVKRADGCFAYQLVVVIDDELQKVTNVVRGEDLLLSTPRQIYIQECLGFRKLQYKHFPLLINNVGEKWSKQANAPSVKCYDPLRLLQYLLQLIPFSENLPETVKIEELLTWAIQHWSSIPPLDKNIKAIEYAGLQ